MVHTRTHEVPAASGKVRLIILWILQVAAGLAFLAAGGAKLAGAEQMVAMFNKIGVGQWLRYLTGLLEVVGGIGLLIPRVAFYAAAMLVLVMVGAVFTHLVVLGGSPVPAIALLLMSGTIAYLRKN
jgi:putative oxidoreductase